MVTNLEYKPTEAREMRELKRETHDWRKLVEDTWALGDAGLMMQGKLPAGVSSQQFWAKVTRAAKRLGGAVGVSVRGGEFWVWTKERGSVGAARDAKAGGRRSWAGLWEALDGTAGGSGPVRIEGVLTREERERLKRTAERQGRFKLGKLEVRIDRGSTIVSVVPR